ncbi:hypothetical protein FRB99_008659, partial [Tulasnella sp. 403]
MQSIVGLVFSSVTWLVLFQVFNSPEAFSLVKSTARASGNVLLGQARNALQLMGFDEDVTWHVVGSHVPEGLRVALKVLWLVLGEQQILRYQVPRLPGTVSGAPSPAIAVSPESSLPVPSRQRQILAHFLLCSLESLVTFVARDLSRAIAPLLSLPSGPQWGCPYLARYMKHSALARGRNRWKPEIYQQGLLALRRRIRPTVPQLFRPHHERDPPCRRSAQKSFVIPGQQNCLDALRDIRPRRSSVANGPLGFTTRPSSPEVRSCSPTRPRSRTPTGRAAAAPSPPEDDFGYATDTSVAVSHCSDIAIAGTDQSDAEEPHSPGETYLTPAAGRPTSPRLTNRKAASPPLTPREPNSPDRGMVRPRVTYGNGPAWLQNRMTQLFQEASGKIAEGTSVEEYVSRIHQLQLEHDALVDMLGVYPEMANRTFLNGIVVKPTAPTEDVTPTRGRASSSEGRSTTTPASPRQGPRGTLRPIREREDVTSLHPNAVTGPSLWNKEYAGSSDGYTTDGRALDPTDESDLSSLPDPEEWSDTNEPVIPRPRKWGSTFNGLDGRRQSTSSDMTIVTPFPPKTRSPPPLKPALGVARHNLEPPHTAATADSFNLTIPEGMTNLWNMSNLGLNNVSGVWMAEELLTNGPKGEPQVHTPKDPDVTMEELASLDENRSTTPTPLDQDIA